MDFKGGGFGLDLSRKKWRIRQNLISFFVFEATQIEKKVCSKALLGPIIFCKMDNLMKISEKLKKNQFLVYFGPKWFFRKSRLCENLPEIYIQFTGCSQASLNIMKDLLEGIRWFIIVFAPLPVSTPARPKGAARCGDWEGGKDNNKPSDSL